MRPSRNGRVDIESARPSPESHPAAVANHPRLSVTLAVAVAFVLAFQAEVAKPYRIPTSSMEPTLHCARPGAWCEGRFDDRVIANRVAYRFGDPKRGQISSSRLRQQPNDADGKTAARRSSSASSDSPARRSRNATVSSTSMASVSSSRTSMLCGGVTRAGSGHASRQPLLRHGRQQDSLLRLPHMGNGAPEQPHRPRGADVLAAEPRLVPLEPRPARTGDMRLESSRMWRRGGFEGCEERPTQAVCAVSIR